MGQSITQGLWLKINFYYFHRGIDIDLERTSYSRLLFIIQHFFKINNQKNHQKTYSFHNTPMATEQQMMQGIK